MHDPIITGYLIEWETRCVWKQNRLATGGNYSRVTSELECIIKKTALERLQRKLRIKDVTI